MASTLNYSTHLSHSFPQNPTFPSFKNQSLLTLIPHSHSQNQVQTLNHTLVVTGGSKLSGHVHISGSKNSALAVLAGTLCCSGGVKLNNIPSVADVTTMISVLRSLGVVVEFCNGEVIINNSFISSIEPCADDVESIRGGFFVAGPLLARFGEAVVALPGGCEIGARPVDIYVQGFSALGASVELRGRKLYAHAKNSRGLVGGSFNLDFPSVGATETLMMAASMADGVTVLTNVAREPEVIDLARFLTDCGASVEGAGSSTLVINGRKSLHGSEFTIIPDRIEAGTFLIAAAITRSCLSMSPVVPCHLSALTDKLLTAGCEIIQSSPNTLEIMAVPSKAKDLQGFHINTGPFPKFPTDLQPQTTALLTSCKGQSIVQESIFEGRMGHVRELEKLGARIQVCGSTAFIYGKDQGSHLRGSHIAAKDLRSGAALVLAGLAAEGVSEIEGVSHIDRGYENLDTKLCHLGANIARQTSSLAAQV